MADQRLIRYGDKQFELDAGMTLEQAKDIMARHFPELADPQVDTKKEGGDTVYVFSKKAGRKGARAGAGTVAGNSVARARAKLIKAKPSQPPDVLVAAALYSVGAAIQFVAFDASDFAGVNAQVEHMARIRADLSAAPSVFPVTGSVLL